LPAKHRDGAAAFPKTRLSAVVAIRSDDVAVRRSGCERLVAAYWKPVYKYLRVRWRKPPAEAEDLAQAFFAAVFEKSFFQSYDPARARFRTYIRSSLDHFVQDEQKAGRRLKRGGEMTFVSLEFAAAEVELSGAQVVDDVGTLFDIEWAVPPLPRGQAPRSLGDGRRVSRRGEHPRRRRLTRGAHALRRTGAPSPATAPSTQTAASARVRA
jgi:DNA-directed RNA polymerase specialized sigma24 family protein